MGCCLYFTQQLVDKQVMTYRPAPIAAFSFVGALLLGGTACSIQPQNTNTTSDTSSVAALRTTASPTVQDVSDVHPHFSNGTQIVGQDLAPGTYRTRAGNSGCYYARLAGFSGSLEEIIANDNTDAPAVVTISPSDKGFVSRGCANWTQDLSAITANRTSFGDGIYIIGTDVQPGTYRNSGQQGCYYSRLSGFSGAMGEILANDNTDSPAVVTILPSDKGFKSSRCGIWTLLSDSELPTRRTSGPPPDAAAGTVADLETRSYDFRHLRWGMSVAEVAAAEPGAGESEASSQELLRDDSVSGIAARLEFICNEQSGLNSVFIAPYPPKRESLPTAFFTWYRDLSGRYGTGYIVHSRDGRDGQLATPEEVGGRMNRFFRESIEFAVQFHVDSRTTAYVSTAYDKSHEPFVSMMFDSRQVHP
jgi:hypothetical protein